MSFELQVPFRLQGQYALSSVGTHAEVPSTDAHVILEPKGDGYSLRIDGLQRPEDAQLWLPRAFVGLTSLMLDVKSAFTASWNVTDAIPVPHPLPAAAPSFLGSFDVIGDETRPVVVQSGQRVGVFIAPTPSVTMSTPLERAAAAIGRGLEVKHADLLFADDRFRTAVELFAAAAFESSPNARLLTNTMALEVLAPSIDKHPVALDLLETWVSQIDPLLEAAPPDSDEKHAYDSLRRELLVRRTASIRSSVRALVLSALAHRGDASALARAAVAAYDDRSVLVHQGSLEGNRAEVASRDVRQILELIIEARLFGVAPPVLQSPVA